MVVVIPLRLDNEAAWMHRALEPRDAAGNPKLDHIRVAGARQAVVWGNASVTVPTTDAMLAYAAKPYGGPYGRAALMVDRRLTPAERKLFQVFPLWTDADVVLAAPDSPLCRDGLALRRVRDLLTGKARGLRLTVPVTSRGTGRPLFDVNPASTVPTGPEVSLVSAAPPAGSAVATGYQLARPALEANRVCAVPIDGVAPTVASVRSGRYPVSRPVGLAFNKSEYRSKRVGAFGLALRARFLAHATGPLGQAFVERMFGSGRLPGW